MTHATLVELALAGARARADRPGPRSAWRSWALAGCSAWGFVADRIAARWPEPRGRLRPRPIDWRTAVVVRRRGGRPRALPLRFDRTAGAARLFGAWFLVLILLLATDLDQRLLPDVVTLPIIPIAAGRGLSGANPLVGMPSLVLALVIAAIAIPAVLFVLSIPFGPGAIGLGDIKLLVRVGLLTGRGRPSSGVVAALLLVGRRHPRPARRPPDHAEELHPVRAVPDHRRVLGGAAPRAAESTGLLIRDHRPVRGKLDARPIRGV